MNGLLAKDNDGKTSQSQEKTMIHHLVALLPGLSACFKAKCSQGLGLDRKLQVFIHKQQWLEAAKMGIIQCGRCTGQVKGLRSSEPQNDFCWEVCIDDTWSNFRYSWVCITDAGQVNLLEV